MYLGIIVEYLDGGVRLTYPDSCTTYSSSITGPVVMALTFSHGVSPKLDIGDVVRIRRANNDGGESQYWAEVLGIKKTGTYSEFRTTTVRVKPLDSDEVPFETLVAFNGIHGIEVTAGTAGLFGCTGAVAVSDRAKGSSWNNEVSLSVETPVDTDKMIAAIRDLGRAIQKSFGLDGQEGEEMYLPEIEKIIFNPPATVVMWSDGTKTVVKTHGKGKKADKFREDYGLAMAIAKKYFGNRSQFLKAVENASRRED